jgi:HK97 family phage portal protein
MATRALRLWGHRGTDLDGPVEDRALARRQLDAQSPPVLLAPTFTTPPAVTATTALAIADAYACVRALADAAASIPLHCYRRTTAGRERLEGRTADLLGRPAPAATQANLIGQLMAHLQLHGNAYVGKFRDGDGRVEQLALLHPERVIPELRAGRPVYTVLDGHGRRSEHTPADIVHIRGLGTDGLVGLSPVRQARAALGLAQQLTDHAQAFFRNDARPSGILRVNTFGQPTVATPDGESDLDQLRQAWQAGHQGTGNAHNIAVVSGEVEYTQVGMPLEDAQFLEQRKLSTVEVARIFRVPPWVVGAESGDSMTYSNVEQQALHFVTYSLRPWLVVIEQALSGDPDLFTTRTYCEFLLDALLRADSATRAEVYTKALDPLTGWMSRDEVRRLENLEVDG